MANVEGTPLNTYDLEALLSSFSRSLIRANEQILQETLLSVKRLCFEGGKDGDKNWGQLRTVEFSFKSADNNKEAKLSVPLMTLLTLPALQIKHCDIEFDAELLDAKLSAEDPPKIENLNISLINNGDAEAGSTPDKIGRVSVRMHYYEPDLAASWGKVMNILNNNILLKED